MHHIRACAQPLAFPWNNVQAGDRGHFPAFTVHALIIPWRRIEPRLIGVLDLHPARSLPDTSGIILRGRGQVLQTGQMLELRSAMGPTVTNHIAQRTGHRSHRPEPSCLLGHPEPRTPPHVILLPGPSRTAHSPLVILSRGPEARGEGSGWGVHVHQWPLPQLLSKTIRAQLAKSVELGTVLNTASDVSRRARRNAETHN